ncbi:GNAT family N-acetyltransferase [Paenibacillus sp. NPDC058071]|uniref:GNAT family N-acetyltransferase n=1 Tax=Paenibacillus sp. NPDC058071 TaxID=3346326 RepID=UPI0036D8A75B
MDLYIANGANDAGKSHVINGLIHYNRRHVASDLNGNYREVQLYLKDADNRVYGGLLGEICWNWLEIKILFVDESVRKSGYGTKLLQEAEKLAKENKCEFIKLDTLSFQALDFYKRHGFEVFGTIENAARHTHYYLKKDL